MIAKVLWTTNTRSVVLHFCKINLTSGQHSESQPELQWPGNINFLLKKINKKYSTSLLHGFPKTLYHQKQMLLSATAETVPSSKESWNPSLSQGLSIGFSIPFVYRLFIWLSNKNK